MIVAAADDYLHARCRTRLGFVDDVEFLLCPAEGVIHVRSASYISLFTDFGANRRRVECSAPAVRGRIAIRGGDPG